eukprot:COSAG02_NODE_25841_length_647_cov_1.437956_1_plen_25_part_10
MQFAGSDDDGPVGALVDGALGVLVL